MLGIGHMRSEPWQMGTWHVLGRPVLVHLGRPWLAVACKECPAEDW